MVDVSSKTETKRVARAHAFVKLRPSVLDQLSSNPKGNPLEIARIAVISAVGTRGYYRKLGFEWDGLYMTREL